MNRKSKLALALLGCCIGSAAPAQEAAAPAAAAQPELVVAPAEPPSGHPEAVVVPKDTMVRLMVLNEVNTHRAKPGDTFVLRVDENVSVGGTTVIPVGARATGEVTLVEANGAVGKGGTIAARLLYVDVNGQRIPLSGEDQSKGSKGGDRVALAAVAFGPFGLLARGAQGKLKAGHIFNGYLADDLLFDRATGAFILPEPAPAPLSAAQ
jgi:hypothetical protein